MSTGRFLSFFLGLDGFDPFFMKSSCVWPGPSRKYLDTLAFFGGPPLLDAEADDLELLFFLPPPPPLLLLLLLLAGVAAAVAAGEDELDVLAEDEDDDDDDVDEVDVLSDDGVGVMGGVDVTDGVRKDCGPATTGEIQ